MSKVIIITRSGEYKNRPNFGDAIDESIKGTCPYKNRTALIAESKWQTAKNSAKTDKGFDEAKAVKAAGLDECLDKYLCLAEEDEVEGTNKAEEYILTNLIEKERGQTPSPYASFKCNLNNDTVEVILVLPENLGINSQEAITDIVGFVNCVLEDCKENGEDNILYIHDRQLDGEEIDDTTVWDKKNKVDGFSGRFEKLKDLQSKFKFIAIFKHLPYPTSYFQSQILSQRFGMPTLIDKLKGVEEKVDKEGLGMEDMAKMINAEVKSFK